MMYDFNQFMINILTEYGEVIAKTFATVWVAVFVIVSIRSWRKASKIYKEAPDQFRLW